MDDRAELIRLNTGIARSVMQALGRPNPSRGERVFTDEDIELVRAHKEFVEAGLPRDEMLATDDVVERSDGFEWKRRRRRALAGISDRVRLYELQS
jgi:hypothetical protein